MSGHSKWSQIKRKKGAADVKRGAAFGKLAKAITVAARLGKNLDMAIATAKAANMPKDNIDRAIKRGTGELADGMQIEQVLYEAYGPGGAALLISTFTDNRNRTVNELRAVGNKREFSLAQPGAVQYLFEQKGIFEVEVGADADATELLLIDAGADAIERDDDRMIVFVAPNQASAFRDALLAAGLSIHENRLSFVPKTTVTLAEDARDKLLKALEAIDELDDVEAVETSAEL